MRFEENVLAKPNFQDAGLAYKPGTGKISKIKFDKQKSLTISGKALKVEDIGFEPMTPCVQGRCSSQLS